MDKKIALYTILFAFGATSCSPKVVPTAVEKIHDTTYVEKIISYRDTTVIYIPPVEAEKNTTTDSSSYLETSLARSSASINNGVLTHTLENKHEPIYIPAKMPVQQVYTNYISSSFERIPVEVPAEWSMWQNFVQVVGYIALAVVVIRFALSFLKKLLQPL